MKRGYYLLELFGSVADAFVVEAVESREPARPALGKKRVLLVAAVIALAALLVGCAIVYTLNLQNLKMGTLSAQIPAKVYDDGTSSKAWRKDFDLLTLSGVPGTPAYQAAQEWIDFSQAYDSDFAIRSSFQGNWPDFGEEYSRYSIYTQEMADKLDEIRNRYQLKPMGPSQPLTGQDFAALGLDSGLRISSGKRYACGSMDLMFCFSLPETDEIWAELNYRRKDAFIGDTLLLGSTHQWTQETIAASAGVEVLVIHSSTSASTYLLCDLGDATVTITFLTDTQWKTDENGLSYATDWLVLSQDQLKQIISQLEPYFYNAEFWADAISK